MEKDFGKRKELAEKPRVMKEIQYFGVVGFFDEATKDGLCATRVFLLINNYHIYNFRLYYGAGSNMRQSCYPFGVYVR